MMMAIGSQLTYTTLTSNPVLSFHCFDLAAPDQGVHNFLIGALGIRVESQAIVHILRTTTWGEE